MNIVILGNSRSETIGAILSSLCDAFDLPKEIYCIENHPLSTQFASPEFQIHTLSPDDPDSSDVRLLFIPAERDLAQQIHQLYHWREKFEIQTILSIMDHTFFDASCPNLRDAMAHFADLLFIDNINSAISKEPLKTYIHYCTKKECYPLTIKVLNSPDVTHIRELNDLRSKRMTLIFDDIDPIDLLDDDNYGPFTIPTLDQCDKYLKQDDEGRYLLPIESLF